jgi:hypothetical protein
MLTEENVRRGLPSGEARRQAILRFGGPVQIKEERRQKRGLPLIDTMLQDVRYALRSLRRNPAFTALAILTLAIGVAATTSMFTVAEAVLLRPLPFAQPDRLVEISEVNPLKGWTHTVAAPANFADWRARNTVFSDIAAYIGVDDRSASERQLFLSGDGEARPEAYVALAASVQNPVTFVVRTSDGVDAAVAAARREVRAVDKDLTLTDISTLSALIEDSLGEERFRTTLLAGFAGVALFLAALGVYGVLAYVVTQRSRELGIRLALGAKRQELFTMVVRQGMRPVFAGAAAGLVAAIAITGLMESLRFGVHAGDPTTYAIALPALSAVALAACAIPGLRATRVDPLTALREE